MINVYNILKTIRITYNKIIVSKEHENLVIKHEIIATKE